MTTQPISWSYVVRMLLEDRTVRVGDRLTVPRRPRWFWPFRWPRRLLAVVAVTDGTHVTLDRALPGGTVELPVFVVRPRR